MYLNKGWKILDDIMAIGHKVALSILSTWKVWIIIAKQNTGVSYNINNVFITININEPVCTMRAPWHTWASNCICSHYFCYLGVKMMVKHKVRHCRNTPMDRKQLNGKIIRLELHQCVGVPLINFINHFFFLPVTLALIFSPQLYKHPYYSHTPM